VDIEWEEWRKRDREMKREHTSDDEEEDGNDGGNGEYWEEDGGVIRDVAEIIHIPPLSNQEDQDLPIRDL